jgi:hypothetical protein
LVATTLKLPPPPAQDAVTPSWGQADGTWAKRLQLYLRSKLLVLDDFGLKSSVDPAPAHLYAAMNECSEVSSILVTSSRAPTE